ncbi:hypothetical protein JCM10213v2_008891 [Rhodosporidiobolus nylandii]
MATADKVRLLVVRVHNWQGGLAPRPELSTMVDETEAGLVGLCSDDPTLLHLITTSESRAKFAIAAYDGHPQAEGCDAPSLRVSLGPPQIYLRGCDALAANPFPYYTTRYFLRTTYVPLLSTARNEPITPALTSFQATLPAPLPPPAPPASPSATPIGGLSAPGAATQIPASAPVPAPTPNAGPVEQRLAILEAALAQSSAGRSRTQAGQAEGLDNGRVRGIGKAGGVESGILAMEKDSAITGNQGLGGSERDPNTRSRRRSRSPASDDFRPPSDGAKRRRLPSSPSRRGRPDHPTLHQDTVDDPPYGSFPHGVSPSYNSAKLPSGTTQTFAPFVPPPPGSSTTSPVDAPPAPSYAGMPPLIAPPTDFSSSTQPEDDPSEFVMPEIRSVPRTVLGMASNPSEGGRWSDCSYNGVVEVFQTPLVRSQRLQTSFRFDNLHPTGTDGHVKATSLRMLVGHLAGAMGQQVKVVQLRPGSKSGFRIDLVMNGNHEYKMYEREQLEATRSIQTAWGVHPDEAGFLRKPRKKPSKNQGGSGLPPNGRSDGHPGDFDGGGGSYDYGGGGGGPYGYGGGGPYGYGGGNYGRGNYGGGNYGGGNYGGGNYGGGNYGGGGRRRDERGNSAYDECGGSQGGSEWDRRGPKYAPSGGAYGPYRSGPA